MSERDKQAAELAASMPDDQAALLDVAMASVDDLHAAAIGGDQKATRAAADRYEATVWKLNGGTFFGCMADVNAPGHLVERHCRAVPGEVPKWGQSGDFLIEVEGIRAMVEFGDGMSLLHTEFIFHAVDLDKPFISETGYRCHYDDIYLRQCVDEAAAAVFAAYLKDKKHPIDEEYRDRLAKGLLPAWLVRLDPPACRSPATISVPPGHELVDVILPKHQAFIARKWAAQAQERLAAKAADLYAKKGMFKPGLRCEVVKVYRRCFAKELGKPVIITRVDPDSMQVWAYMDRPVEYKICKGRREIFYDPKCRTYRFHFDQLRPFPDGEAN